MKITALILVFLLSLQLKVSAQIGLPLKFKLYLLSDSIHKYHIESFLLDRHYSDSVTACKAINTNELYKSFCIETNTKGEIYEGSLGNTEGAFSQRLIITHLKDTMVIDFSPYADAGGFIDSIFFVPGYFIISLLNTPDYSYWYHHIAITKNIKENTSWLKEYKLNSYKKLITPCSK